MKRNIVLIASYPKSGSTWLRFVLESLNLAPGYAISLNEMGSGHYGAWRRMLFDEMAPVNAADLLASEIDDRLPAVFGALSDVSGPGLLIKAHDSAIRTASGGWLYPPDRVGAVLYLVRHPFDIAVSYAHHLGVAIEEAVALMGEDSIIGAVSGRVRLPLHEHVGSWSGNVASWLGDTPYRVTLARYEDMLADPFRELRRLAAAAGFPDDEHRLAQAIDAGRFERLSRDEVDNGFLERPRSSPRFFRAGRVGSWQGLIDQAEQSRLLRDHGAMMARLGYEPDGTAHPIGPEN